MEFVEREYLEFIEYTNYENVDAELEIFDKRHDKYFEIPKAEKEKFAHKYADNLKIKLTKMKIIPFEPK